MIQVGDIVLFNHGVHETVMTSDQPLAAIVTYILSRADGDRLVRDASGYDIRVNLAVFGKNGDQWQKHNVTFWNGEGDAPEARLEFAYPAEVNLAQRYKDNAPAPDPVANDPPEHPADPGSDVVPRSTRGPNKLASGPATRSEYSDGYDIDPANIAGDKPEWNGDAPTGFEMVNPPIGPEYKPNAEHPMPNAPEPINKVPAESPANPDRPLD